MDFSKRNILLSGIFALALILFSGYHVLFSPPVNFPSGSVISINDGMPATDIAKELSDVNLVKHPVVLEILLRISGTSEGVRAGVYLFNTPENVFMIAHRLITADYGLPPARITFIEGVTVREMGLQIANAIPSISSSDFSEAAKQYEGYLFPDTYFFSPSSDVASIIKIMRENFDAKISSLTGDIKASEHSLQDVIIIASLVEKEVRTNTDRKIVAGILWNRLKIGMPLQVDAVFGYIFNRNTYSPSLSDLKVDSPYNVYTHTGLPPGPIDNPGLDSIDATLHPTKTNYLYYLTDKDGVMHYATNFAGHKSNQQKYLN